MHGTEPFFEDHRADSAFIHEASYVDAPCRIGEQTRVLPFAHVMAHTIIGDYCVIGPHASVGSGVYVANHVKIMNNALLNSGVIMENDVYCGANTVFAEGRHLRAAARGMSRISPTLVRQGAHIAPGSAIVAGSTIGRFAFVEANTVVDRNIPDFAVVCGNPLRFTGWRCECGQGLAIKADGKGALQDETVQCSYCGKHYQRQAKWKIVPLSREMHSLDSDSRSDAPIRRHPTAD